MIELIPAIDIIGGKCVRLSQGKYESKKIYSSDPLEVASNFEEMGITRLHLVDLDGAKAGKVINLDVLDNIASNTDLVIDFGGGIKTTDTVRDVLNAGASMLTAGSIAVKDTDLVKSWLEEFGPEKIILGADVRDRKIAIHGWKEDSDLDLFEFILSYSEAGISRVICTDIAVDGMLTGPSTDLYLDLRDAFPGLEIIASGGVSAMEDIMELDSLGLKGVIFGKAFYEGNIPSGEIINFLKSG